MKEPICTNYPFTGFQPIYWNPSRDDAGEEGRICSVKRDHGVKGTYRLHNPRDQINDDHRFLEKILVEYRIGRISYPLFTVGDFFEVGHSFDPKAAGNIMGDIAERIARRVTKYFLKHYSRQGYTGGIFDERFNPAERDDFIVAHTGQYVLKIQKYPNLVILKRTGKGKYGYENIKELDGLFDYRYKGTRHILVLESKMDRINVDCEFLAKNLFKPLRQLFPEACFSFILFSDKKSIYMKKGFRRLRQLKQVPIAIHQRLKQEGIGTLFFTFNESAADFERIKDHLITQYRSIARLGVTLRGRMEISHREIMLFDEGETPHMKLVKDVKTGLWREVKLTHKKKIVSQTIVPSPMRKIRLRQG
jgi:hypothetical protein